MRRIISIFFILGSVLSFSSCNKDVDKAGAILVDETALHEVPAGKLRFSWRGDRNVQQKLVMWLDGYEYETPNLKEPMLFQLGISSFIQPDVDDVYSVTINLWNPLKGKKYHWAILSYYEDGTVLESNIRDFYPNSK